jgi:hypothetical protein
MRFISLILSPLSIFNQNTLIRIHRNSNQSFLVFGLVKMLVKLNRRFVICITVFAFMLVLFSYQRSIRYDFKIVSATPRHDDSIYMLFWNSYLDEDDLWGMEKEISSPEDLKKVNCPVTNCIFTNQKDVLPNVHDFDVLFFNHHTQIQFPKTRSLNQFYIFSMFE